MILRIQQLKLDLRQAQKNLYDVYIKEGLMTPEKIGPKYAPVGASNDPNNMNKQWIPTVKSMMKKLSDGDGAVCKSTGGKDIKFNGKLPKWSNSDAGKGNLYTAGQCTWYAYGIRQKWENRYRRIGSMRNFGMIERKMKVIK